MARILRPTRLEHVLDGHALRARLSAAAFDALGDELAQRTAAIGILKNALFRGRMICKERLDNGAGGLETARLISAVTDEVITALYDFTTVHVFRARNPTEGERIALLAVGGYGRNVLAPFSDIDLLFLRPYKQTPHVESVIEYMLYALWDLGFKVGHASRTVTECVRLSKQDFTIRTSLLEARQLTGDASLFKDLQHRFREEVIRNTGSEFVAAKLKERDERHNRAGMARYAVEPNVKEGKGGLRDLHTLTWIAEYLHPVDRPEDVYGLAYFDKREVALFLQAFEFLHAVRAHLHFVTGRPEERLSFDLQPEIAMRMGYGDRADNPAVERFMRRYFMITKEVGVLTRTFSAKLESDELKREPKGLSRLLDPRRSTTRKPLEHKGFVMDGGRLSIEEPAIFEADPTNLLRLFRLADTKDLDLHPDAFTAVRRSLSLVTARLRRDPVATRLFIEILTKSRSLYRVLSLMNDSGLLGRFIPEFGRIVAQMQFNMYHSYTVDEHTLRACGIIRDIAAGHLQQDHPLASSIMPLIDDLQSLYLAMLLHDTGKGGEGGQEKAGARSARQACERLGLPREKIELVAWLVEHHLVMSDFAQKRDVADPATVTAFAEIVESPERMRLLLVLTVADIRAVGPGVWNGWKGQLLRELYHSTEALFRGGRSSDAVGVLTALQQTRANEARERLLSERPLAKSWADLMEDAYFCTFPSDEIVRHADLAVRIESEGVATGFRIDPDRNATELLVCVADRPGLFADLSLAIARLGGNVVGARVFTSGRQQALDIFFVQDSQGMPFGADSERLGLRLTEALKLAAVGVLPPPPDKKSVNFDRTAAFSISPSVMVDNDSASDSTVVEVSGRDRPGLLESLARTLSEAGLNIMSAHIDGYGERAVDTFYVQTSQGLKLSDTRRLAGLKAVLMEVLSENPDDPSRRKLQRARSSAAR